jgi:menaquinone-dependent protoporphyrinogen oxidase
MNNYAAAIIAAPVRLGRHPQEIKNAVCRNLELLGQMPSMFLSVSLAEAGAVNPAAGPARRVHAAAEVQCTIDRFLAETGWKPTKIEPVAGALMYSKYNFLLRWIMKRIAARSGASTDTSRDHVYTNWTALDRNVGEFTALFAPVQRNLTAGSLV